jgi:pectate lyase
MKKMPPVIGLILLLLSQFVFAQTTLRIEDAATFTSGFCAFDGSRQNSYTGASNGYYINISNSSARGITWKVSVPSNGSYTLRWRYANGGSQSATTGRVLVNGATVAASASFPKTASWTTWTTTTATVSLSAGVNTVRLETIASSEFANIDWIEVVGNSPTAASCSGQPVETYSLTTNASPAAGGSVTRAPNATSYAAGTTVTLTAAPASGYTFSSWSGAVSGTSSSITVTMDANKTVTANFTPVTPNSYTLTTMVSPSAGGSITRSPNASNYTAGTNVTLTAAAASGYTFSNWSGSVSGTSPSITVTMDANKSVTANFAPQNNNGVNFALVGFATLNGGTTGGAGGTSITVNTGTALQNAINSKGPQPLTIYVNGIITPSNSPGLTKIDVKDKRDISILGVGTSGELNGIGIKVVRAGNIIIRNLKIHHVNIGDKDCIGIEGPADHIWVDHCELYNQYQGVDQDYYDGLLDAKSNSEYITYSWNYLHDSWKTGLAGSSESDTYDRKITMHHNFYENCNSRLPLYRGGTGHVFNNYYKDIASTAINSRIGACLQIENNYFLNTQNPYVSAYSDVVGYGELIGNVLVNSPFNYSTDVRQLGPCTVNIPYAYSSVLYSANDVPSIVSSNAGVGKIDVFAASESTTEIMEDVSHSENGVIAVTVSPNPSAGVSTINFRLPGDGIVHINVSDVTGKVVSKIPAKRFSKGEHSVPLDLYSNKKGLYILRLRFNANVTTRKIVVE